MQLDRDIDQTRSKQLFWSFLEFLLPCLNQNLIDHLQLLKSRARLCGPGWSSLLLLAQETSSWSPTSALTFKLDSTQNVRVDSRTVHYLKNAILLKMALFRASICYLSMLTVVLCDFATSMGLVMVHVLPLRLTLGCGGAMTMSATLLRFLEIAWHFWNFSDHFWSYWNILDPLWCFS